MLQPDDKEKTISTLTMQYKPDLNGLLETLGSYSGSGSVSMNPLIRGPDSRFKTASSPRSRALAEVILSRHIMQELEKELIATDLYNTFQGELS